VERLPGLDVLRAVAILMVLGHHAPALPEGALFQSFTAVWKRCGWAGVDLFFALSGFLIMALLLAEQERTGAIDVKAFVIRRLFKIYPPYVAFIAAVIAWEHQHGQGSPFERLNSVAGDLSPVLAQLQNYVPVQAASHLWSLAMEEHCYALLLALAVFQASRRPDRLSSLIIPIAVSVLFAASWLARWAHVAWSYSGEGTIGFTYTHYRIDAVLAGVLAAWFVRTRRDRTLGGRTSAGLAALAVACFVPTLFLEPYEHRALFLVGVLPLQAIGFGCLLVAIGAASPLAGRTREPAMEGRRASWLIRLLAFVGVSSYSTYLWHLPFVDSLIRILPVGYVPIKGAALIVAAFVTSALGLGALMFLLIEKPAQVYRRRWQAGSEMQVQRCSLPAEVA